MPVGANNGGFDLSDAEDSQCGRGQQAWQHGKRLGAG